MAALLLAALAWVGARNAMLVHRGETRARVEAELLAATQGFEEQLRRELLSLDQTLRFLEYEWQGDPDHFDLTARASQAIMLSDVSLQLFITDAHGIVRASTRSALLGNDVSSRDYFRYESALPADDGRMFVGELTQGQITRLWQINLVRRLDNPDGSFAGVIAASYDTNSFIRYYHEVGLGKNALIAVVSERDGTAWTLGGADEAPLVIRLTDTPTFSRLVQSADGAWAGASDLDAGDRLYAFATVPDYGLKVVIGVDRETAMQGATEWETNARLFTGGITLLILLLAALLLRAQDVTRRRHEELARERAILEGTLTGMSDGIMMVDGELRLMAWNRHFPELTGVPTEILRIGLPMEEILRAQAVAGEFGPIDAGAEVERRMSVLRSGGGMGTIERPRPGGRQLEIRRSQLPGGGFVSLYTDVTARRQTEERLHQAQTLAAIGRLTAGVAHDFNNLLAAIMGNAEILYSQLEDEQGDTRRVAMILQTAGRGADLVRQLLAFSRKQELVPVVVDLNSIVRGMGDLLRATLGRLIRTETHLHEALWPALIDPVQIEHVILNLAINARDAMPDGGTLTIATANRTLHRDDDKLDLAAGDYVVVSVADTGTGMTDEVLHNAFEPFFTTKPPGQGSGLGLSQVYGVASQSGGGVWIDSTLGKGTTVSVLLPRAAKEAQVASGAEAATVTDPATGRRRILVVDDDAEVRDTVSAVLESNGFAATTAPTGEAALRLADEGLDFQLLLVDFAMPDMNGGELADEMRARRPALPVVFLAVGDGEWVSGERWVLRKPLAGRSLIETLHTALGQPRETAIRRSPQKV
ncbi:MAG TPA: PAS-domain containing protein [Acetobacteraceae bacterium]|nr:PAS-domain containing protein [Acetobacteraceae bacterium]